MVDAAAHPLGIACREVDGVAVIELLGHLDLLMDEDLVCTVADARERGLARCVIDCAGLESLRSGGVSALLAVYREASGGQGDLALARVSPEAATLMDRLGVSAILRKFDTVESAVEALKNAPPQVQDSGPSLDRRIASAIGLLLGSGNDAAVMIGKKLAALQDEGGLTEAAAMRALGEFIRWAEEAQWSIHPDT